MVQGIDWGGIFAKWQVDHTHIKDVHANDVLDDIGTQYLGPLGL